MVSAGGIPQEAEHVAHEDMITSPNPFTTEAPRHRENRLRGKARTFTAEDAEFAEKTYGVNHKGHKGTQRETGQSARIGLVP